MQGLCFNEIEMGAHPCVCVHCSFSALAQYPSPVSNGAPYLMGISVLCLLGHFQFSLDTG